MFGVASIRESQWMNISKKAVNGIYCISTEIASIVVAIKCLNVTANVLLKQTPHTVQRFKIWESVVAVPFVEEILFRFLLQGGIALGQNFKNRAWKPLNEEQMNPESLKTQQVFRIRLSAAVMAIMHARLLWEQSSLGMTGFQVAGMGVQMGMAYLAGSSLGYLKERYRTIAWGIFLHGINNALKSAGILASRYNFYWQLPFYLSLVGWQGVCYILAHRHEIKLPSIWGTYLKVQGCIQSIFSCPSN